MSGPRARRSRRRTEFFPQRRVKPPRPKSPRIFRREFLDYFLEEKGNNTANFSPYGTRVETEFAKLQEDFLLGNINIEQFKTNFTKLLNDIIKTTY